MIKVDIPAGASLDHLAVGGDGDVIVWPDDKVSLSLGLYDKLDQSSVVKVDSGRQVTLNAKKATPEWWPKLTKGPKPGNVKVDWASWKDEDEGTLFSFAKRSLPAPSGAGPVPFSPLPHALWSLFLCVPLPICALLPCLFMRTVANLRVQTLCRALGCVCSRVLCVCVCVCPPVYGKDLGEDGVDGGGAL